MLVLAVSGVSALLVVATEVSVVSVVSVLPKQAFSTLHVCSCLYSLPPMPPMGITIDVGTVELLLWKAPFAATKALEDVEGVVDVVDVEDVEDVVDVVDVVDAEPKQDERGCSEISLRSESLWSMVGIL